MIYYFNWYDLLKKSKKDNESIIVLTYASTYRYNKKIASNSKELLRKLNINTYEIIFVDDGSPDNSRSKVIKILNKNIKIQKIENLPNSL